MIDESDLIVYVQPGSVSFSEIMELFLSINDLYVKMGGDGFRLFGKDMLLEEVPESPFEGCKDTPFANTKKSLRDATFPRYVPRQQVYDAIDDHVKPDKVAQIRQDIDKKFPEARFGDVFPHHAVFSILFNEYLPGNRKGR